MKKRIVTTILGIGLGFGLIGPASAVSCTAYYNSCVDQGTSQTTCERMYIKCIRYNWDDE